MRGATSCGDADLSELMDRAAHNKLRTQSTRPWRAVTKAGDAYTPAVGDAVVEVVAGTTRHTVVTVVRLR
ncbi:hypothetical protein AB0H86_26470 [Streptomyces sp. NPDC050997]|uniref:hypothetical protein n=1 Tax=Streptomyces sp. NPDC050997 TaxID=3155519 RepID=UPI00343CF7E4